MAFNNNESDKKDLASYTKVAQLQAAIKSGLDVMYFERILQNEGDINYDVSVSNNNSINDEMNSNLLHSAYSNDRYYIFEHLVSHGADFTITDSKNRTVIHRAVHDNYNDFTKVHHYIVPILSAHVKVGNSTNSRCKYGVTHFHIACMAKHVEAVTFFLESGVAVDQAVNKNSPIFAGYTPLHFAARHSCLEVAQILLSYGANVHVKNAVGMTPLHILMERKINDGLSKWPRDEARENMIKLLLNVNINERIVDDYYGISNLHVACILEDTSVAENILTDPSLDVNHTVCMDSPIYPGYTPLHFAATCNMNTVKILLMKGADTEAKDANNITPFDLCLQNYNVEDIHYVMSSQAKWREIMLSDGKTRLLDLVAAMKNVDEFRQLVIVNKSIADLTIPMDSALWPGYTILHLAVAIFERAGFEKDFGDWICECQMMEEYFDRGVQMIEECFVRGIDITKRDANNRTALHLAFYLDKESILGTLMKHHLTVENPFDSNNLSHFHIACAIGNENAVQRFLSNGFIDVDVPIRSMIKWPVQNCCHDSKYKHEILFFSPGSTALHFTMAFARVEMIKMLLDHGANVYAKDCNGFTPIHRLLTRYTKYFIPDLDNLLSHLDELLSSLDGLQDSMTDCGLSHLHVACYSGLPHTVEKLLNNGADVNSVVNCKATNSNNIDKRKDYIFNSYDDSPNKVLSFLSRYNGFTPLDFSIHSTNPNISILLVKRGADVFIGNSLKNCQLIDYDMIETSASSNQLKDQLGLIELHIACYTRRLELVEQLLLQDKDVNAKSPVTYGNTPLHFSVVDVFGAEYESTELIELLLKYGADVTLRNDNGNTALDLLYRKHMHKLADCESANLLLKSVKGFENDHIYSQGMSFFHYACLMKNAGVAEGFLKNGIDVNKPVDYFADKYPGSRPLHLAVGYQSKRFEGVNSQIQLINLLLKHGADTHAVDVFENTSLHRAVSCYSSRKIIFNILIRHGADVNAENICGETALEALMKSKNAKWEEVQCLLKEGSRIKFYNPISQNRYIDNLIQCHDHGVCFYDEDSKSSYGKVLDNEILCNLINSEYVTRIDHEGRNFLQNIVSLGYINDEDHLELMRRLIKRGCHINHQDNEGKTVLHLATLFRDYHSIRMFMKNGADVNIIDNHGKTAFAYCFEDPHYRCSSNLYTDQIFITFSEHLHKMERCGLRINDINRQLRVSASEMPGWAKNELKLFEENIERAKSINIGSTDLTLYDFGFKINAEMVYRDMSNIERFETDQFFENISQHNLYELDYLLKFKFEKARDMLLINLAVGPFSIIIKTQLPELCCRMILSFLSSADLENVIATLKDSR